MKKLTFRQKERLCDVLFYTGVTTVLPLYIGGLVCTCYQMTVLAHVFVGLSILAALTAGFAMVWQTKL